MKPGPARPQSPSLRQGRKVGRTLYVQRGYQPSGDDELVGVVDSPALASVIVAAVNGDSDMRDRLRSACSDSSQTSAPVDAVPDERQSDPAAQQGTSDLAASTPDPAVDVAGTTR